MTPKRVMRLIRAYFFTGLVVLIPTIVSVAVLFWVFDLLTSMLPALLKLLPAPGLAAFVDARPFLSKVLGLGIMLCVITLTGLLTRNVIGRRVLTWAELAFLRVPIFSSIYGTVKHISDSFSSKRKDMFRQVVMFEYPKAGTYVLGFVTADAFPEAQQLVAKDLISVFVPTTPNPTSGFLLYVHRRDLHFLKMSVGDGMRLIVSGGMVHPSAMPADYLPPADAATSAATPAPAPDEA